MIFTNDSLGAVTVVLPAGHLSRYTSFWLCLERLYVPIGSDVSSDLGVSVGGSVARNLNDVLRRLKTPWAWIIADDHTFPQDAVLALIAHAEALHLPILSPLVTLKAPRFQPVVGKRMWRENDRIFWEGYGFDEIDTWTQPTKVAMAPNAGMLLHHSVLKVVSEPWFEIGRTTPEDLGEDVYFNWKLQEAGIDRYVDPSVVLGHTGPVTAVPVRDAQGRWVISLEWDKDTAIQVDMRTAQREQGPMRG